MSSNQNGIFVPNRVIFIMVGVSVCINLFFLLLGILIGRDDLKWERSKTPDTVEIQEDTEPSTLVDRELSVFDADTPRDKPLDITYEGTEEKTPEPVTAAEPDPSSNSGTTPIKNETPAAASDGGFWIQALASKDRTQAEAFRDRVRDKGYAAIVLPEGGYYKVQIGPYPDRGRAERDKDKINKALKINCWIRAR